MFKHWMMGAAAAAICCAAPIAASAAPASNTGNMSGAAQHERAVENVDTRRCWWREGRRYCRQVERRRDYGVDFYIGRPRPEDFPTGSTAWWRAMDYEGRGGHGRTP
jgi:hypothetical protein